MPIEPRSVEFHLTVPHEPSIALVRTSVQAILEYLLRNGLRLHRPVMEQLQVQGQRQHIPRLANLENRDDDWTGLTDAAARRKRQNRLNVRAHRTSASSTCPPITLPHYTQANANKHPKLHPHHVTLPPPNSPSPSSPTGLNPSKQSSLSLYLTPHPKTLSSPCTLPPHTPSPAPPSPFPPTTSSPSSNSTSCAPASRTEDSSTPYPASIHGCI
jgi:hypothetical protein